MIWQRGGSRRRLASLMAVAGCSILGAMSGAVRAVAAPTFAETATLTAAGAQVDDGLESAVAMSADGSTVAVTSLSERALQGSVHIFLRSAAGWSSGTQAATLTPSAGANGGAPFLPNAVALSADGSTVAVAETGPNSVGHGALYVFQRPAGAWASTHEAARFTVPAFSGAELGSAVAVSADGSVIAVGVPSDGGLSGAVYVFLRPLAGWVGGAPPTAKLVPSDGDEDFLGIGVGISADGSTIVAGAPVAAVFGVPQGALYVFAEPAAGWANGTQTARLTRRQNVANALLGATAAISGDGGTIVAGAPGIGASGQTFAGALAVFERPAGGWMNATSSATLTASDTVMQSEFGEFLAMSSDGSTIAGGTNGLASATAPAYLFVRPLAGWSDAAETLRLNPPPGATNAFSGVAMSGDGSLVVAMAQNATVGGVIEAGEEHVFAAGGCSTGLGTLCLDDQPADRRWQLRVTYHTAQGGGSAGTGQAIALSPAGLSRGGLFWFFDPTNPEMLVKVIDGCAVNQQFWVFSSATTNVGFDLTVTDEQTGHSKVYGNTDGQAAVPVQDTSAFACSAASAGSAGSAGRAGGGVGPVAAPLPLAALAPMTPLAAGAPLGRPAPASRQDAAPHAAGCVTGGSALCLDGRFAITATFATAQGGGSSGNGQGIGLQSLGVSQGGLFWFFDPTNPEMLIKVLDACALNDKFWVFYAAGTNVGFAVTVTDTQTGQTATYHNTDGTAAPPLQDTGALPCGS